MTVYAGWRTKAKGSYKIKQYACHQVPINGRPASHQLVGPRHWWGICLHAAFAREFEHANDGKSFGHLAINGSVISHQ